MYSSECIIFMKWAGHVANMGNNGNAYNVFVWKPEELLEYLGIGKIYSSSGPWRPIGL
jgi:hypothetical protein